MPLMDNISLETLEGQKESKWDFGRIRMGGTVGYCVASFFSGFLLKGEYVHIFWIISAFMLACASIMLSVPNIKGYRHGKNKASIRVIFKNPMLICMMFIYLVYSVGLSFFNSFYPIYFISIGGKSSFVGIMMTVCSLTEIPCLVIAQRVVNRFGTFKVMVAAGLITTVRWVLLSFLINPVLIIAVNLLHGAGYIGFMYCIIVYINESVPKDLRATSQSLNVLISTFFSRIVFGYIGGVVSDLFGVNCMLLLSGLLIFSATIVFIFWHRSLEKKTLSTV